MREENFKSTLCEKLWFIDMQLQNQIFNCIPSMMCSLNVFVRIDTVLDFNEKLLRNDICK